VRTILAGLVMLLGSLSAATADDQAKYGPDWPVCRNVQGNPNGVLEACGRLIKANVLSQQHLSWAYNDMGTALERLNRPDLAFADFKKAMEIDPTNHAPYYNVGDLFYRAGRLSDALEFYDKGIALKPDIPDIFCQRGRLLQQMNREDEAWDSYGRELARDPGNDCALYGYTKIAQERHEEGKAIAVFDRALGANPNDAESYHRRGTLYLDLGQYDHALADLDNAVKLDPRDLNALLARGDAYRELGRLDEALADDDAAFNLKPDDPVVYIERARVELLRGDYTAAASDCDQRQARFPHDAACADLGWHIAMLAGKFETAAGKASTLVDRRQPVGLFYRGAANFGAGKLAEAAQDFEQYTSAAPDDPYGWLWLYLIDRALGKDAADRIRPMAAKRDAWPNIVLRHVVGLASADDVLAAADVPDDQVKRQRVAEANYYLGALAALDGHPDDAAKLYTISVDAGRAALDSRKTQLVYKADDDLERALANAALHGKGL
jgi:tetratricopeptide (TPR) repeat protein